jgi:uncharacterized cupin superfamily protein
MKKINLDAIPWVEQRSPKGKYHKFRRSAARAMDGAKAGPRFASPPPFDVELVRLPPKATNFPFHSHAAEWEFYLILSGTGTLRIKRRKMPLASGDCVMCPPGEPHQITNNGRSDLLYYVIANNAPVDVWHYPDSGKWGSRAIGKFFRLQDADYFDGEE